MIEKSIQQHCQTLSVSCLAAQPLEAAFCIVAAPLPALQNQKTEFMHPEELAFYSRLLYEKRQHSYLLSRYTGKQAIRHLTAELSPLAILIKAGVFEQPLAYYQSHLSRQEKFQVSLSHCEHIGVSIAFFDTHPMGIDIENITPNNNIIIESQLTPKEKDWIRACVYTSHDKLYTLYWTVKEALSKVLRTGMTSPAEIYAIKNCVYKNNCWMSEFENFAQYQSMSFLLGEKLCSIVYPKKTQLHIDISAIQQWSSLHVNDDILHAHIQ